MASRHKELSSGAFLLVQLYQKGGALSKAVSGFVERMATALERKEVRFFGPRLVSYHPDGFRIFPKY